MRLSEKFLPTAPYVFILFHYYCFLKVPITRIIKPTIPIHKETKEILEEHISNNIANNNKPMPSVPCRIFVTSYEK